MHEPVGADRLDDFDLAAPVVAPRAEAEFGPALHATVRHAAEHADEKWDGLHDTRHAECDVVERDGGHGQVVYVRDT